MRPPVETDVHRLFRGYFAGRTVRGNRYGQDRREARHPRQGHAVATWMALRRSELYLRVAFRIPVSGSQSTLRFWRMAYLAYGQARHGLRIWSRDRRRRLVGQREVPVRHPKIAEASDEHIVGRFMPQRRIPNCHVCRQQRCDRYKQFWWHRARWPCTPLVTHIHSGVGSRVQHEVSYGAIAIPYPKTSIPRSYAAQWCATRVASML